VLGHNEQEGNGSSFHKETDRDEKESATLSLITRARRMMDHRDLTMVGGKVVQLGFPKEVTCKMESEGELVGVD
jgi:hypothetical protein